MRFFVKNAAGFSMVQGLIVAGIVAGSSLVTTRLMNDQKKAQKTAEVKDKIEELHQTIYSTLQHKQNCKQTILSNGFQALITANGLLDFSTIESYDTGSARTVAVVGGEYMNDTVIINSIVAAPPVGGTRDLTITYRKIANSDKQTNKVVYGGAYVNKTIKLRVQKNPDNTFSSCYAVTGAGTAIAGVASTEAGNDITKEMCNEMVTTTGQKIFSWDEARSLCLPNAKCPTGQIYTGIDTSGEVKCRNIKDWMDFNQVLDSTPANCPINSKVGFVINNTTKKVTISCGICSTSCDCSNSYDVCESGVCVNRSAPGTCINGTYNRGDSICQGKCISGNWVCPIPTTVCP